MGIVRQTASVRSLWNIFEQGQDAISVVELVKQLKHSMNKTTVYRILDRLEQEGKLHSFNGSDGLRWYAKCHDCSAEKHLDTHPHFQCNECGKVECLSLNIPIPNHLNHQIDQAQILLLGQCDACLA
ncbi:MAG: transcriptional repressor [Bacteroidia bacterium]|nr:transcriptional repressor [Bacteroidia bacterium]